MTDSPRSSASTSAFASPASSTPSAPELEIVDRWWRAANYLTVGQIYLLGNSLLTEPLTPEQIKPRLLGHWGTSPALSFIYAHLNRVIQHTDNEYLYICGPGHGGPAMVANTWLDGTYSERFPHLGQGVEGLAALFHQFSFPGGIPSHAAPETPGSINEGGELGYSLSHAYGAVLDNPRLIAACVVGDGEAETGPLATSWHANKLIDAKNDGAVLPILNLNGYKIANPTLLARIGESELLSLFRGYGYEPVIVSGGFDGEDPMLVHARMARALDAAVARIEQIWSDARDAGHTDRPAWPMIILRTPKGWTGPKEVDGEPVENTWRAHQIPVDGVRENPEHLRILEDWMRSYRADELFDENAVPAADIRSLSPEGDRRMSATPHANGGELRHPLVLPAVEPHAVPAPPNKGELVSATGTWGKWLAEVVRENPHTFRIFGPDETASNRLQAVYEVTDKVWAAEIKPTDQHLAHTGRVTEVLSEHLLHGMLEGYILTGRHGLINTYEAFVHIVDSMFNQHAKWLESAAEVEWREPISPFVYLLSSHVWRQDHNGFSHQDPGFLNLVVNKQAHLVRVYLPPDANTLLHVGAGVFGTTDRITVIVAGKQQQQSWLDIDAAREHVEHGMGVWPWAGNEAASSTDDHTGADAAPDVIFASAGDVPTLEAIAAAQLIRENVDGVRVRFVNVVDLMRLQDEKAHPHGMPDAEYDAIFPENVPVVFAFHGYPSLVHQLAYRRHNHDDMHVHGFAEKGTTTTPFDMVMLNEIDRYTLAMDAVKRLSEKGRDVPAALVDTWQAARVEARRYAYDKGEDHPDVTEWEFHPER